MRATVIACVVILSSVFSAGHCRGQFGGNAAYGRNSDGEGGRARAEQREVSMRSIAPYDLPPTATSTFVDASVLLNVKADEYVAVFSVAAEGDTPAECNTKMDATI